MFNKTTKYAIRILFFMAKNGKELYSTSCLQKNLKIPIKYLRRLMTLLSKKGLVISIQGRSGGFMLAKKPKEIFIADIVDAIEGMNRFNGCILGFDECSDKNPCALHSIWDNIKKVLIPALEQTSLEDLITKNIKKF